MNIPHITSEPTNTECISTKQTTIFDSLQSTCSSTIIPGISQSEVSETISLAQSNDTQCVDQAQTKWFESVSQVQSIESKQRTESAQQSVSRQQVQSGKCVKINAFNVCMRVYMTIIFYFY